MYFDESESGLVLNIFIEPVSEARLDLFIFIPSTRQVLDLAMVCKQNSILWPFPKIEIEASGIFSEVHKISGRVEGTVIWIPNLSPLLL